MKTRVRVRGHRGERATGAAGSQLDHARLGGWVGRYVAEWASGSLVAERRVGGRYACHGKWEVSGWASCAGSAGRARHDRDAPRRLAEVEPRVRDVYHGRPFALRSMGARAGCSGGCTRRARWCGGAGRVL